MEAGRQHTLNPQITGTSILGIKFDNGVVLAADSLGSYGSMAAFRDLPRVFKVNDQTVIAGSGDYADYQLLLHLINERVNSDYCANDGYVYKPKALYSWCTRVLYNRRSNFNPLWNRLAIAGIEDDKPFLGSVDLLGNSYEAPCISTGYGNYLAVPMMRKFLEDNNNKINEQQARDIIDRCIKLLFYRDGRAYDKYSIAVVTKEGVRVEESKPITGNWTIAQNIKGYE